MNTKNLIIAFITVSVAALIVSAFAVFAVARSLNEALLASATEVEEQLIQTVIKAPETTVETEETTAAEASQPPETTLEITEVVSEETENITESPEVITTNTADTTSAPTCYILKLEGGRLVITAPSGEIICERITDVSSLHPKDREALLSGISFSDESEAINAIYDIIS